MIIIGLRLFLFGFSFSLVVENEKERLVFVYFELWLCKSFCHACFFFSPLMVFWDTTPLFYIFIFHNWVFLKICFTLRFHFFFFFFVVLEEDLVL